MKKLYILAILMWMFSAPVDAQPQITSSSNPSFGDTWNVELISTSGFKLGNAGANKVWDMSDIKPMAGFEPFDFKILDPEDGPDKGPKDKADHILFWDLQGYNFYQYEIANDMIRGAIGGIIIDPETITTYTDDDDAIHYPLTYQKKYDFESEYTTSSPFFTFDYSVEGKTEVDGYGKLILPSGEYDNVLRVYIRRESTTTIGGTTEKSLSQQYFWWQEGNGLPLLVYEITTSPGEVEASAYTAIPSITSSNSTVDQRKSFNMFPNPTGLSNEVSFEGMTHDQEITLSNVDGSVVRKLRLGDKSFRPIEYNLKSGMYIIQSAGYLPMILNVR